MSNSIEIPKEIADLLDRACVNPVDLVAPMKRSLSQRTMEILKKNGFGFDVDWQFVIEKMSRFAQQVVSLDTLPGKLSAFARFDFTWLKAQISFTAMIMSGPEKMKHHMDQYKQVEQWYETLMELLMGNVLSILGGTPEQLSLLLTDILEFEIMKAEGCNVKVEDLTRIIEVYLEEMNNE